MIDWSTEFGRKARGHIDRQHVIWLTTVGPDSAPHPRPVWFVWDTDSFLIYSRPTNGKVVHIARNPQVSLNFNTDNGNGDVDVITFVGNARLEPDAPSADKNPAYLAKYGAAILELPMTPAEYGRAYSVAIRVTPTRLWGW